MTVDTPTKEIIWSYATQNPAAPAAQIAATLGVDITIVHEVIRGVGTPLEVRTGKAERIRLLEDAITLTAGDRNRAYGPPYDNLDAAAQMVSAYISAKYKGSVLTETFRLTAEDMSHIMQLGKMTRTFYGAYRPDNYTDNAAYGAIAGECRRQDEEGPR